MIAVHTICHGKHASIASEVPSVLTNNQASLLRQIVAGPRARHPEAGLDLCYVTDNSTKPPPHPELMYFQH